MSFCFWSISAALEPSSFLHRLGSGSRLPRLRLPDFKSRKAHRAAPAAPALGFQATRSRRPRPQRRQKGAPEHRFSARPSDVRMNPNWRSVVSSADWPPVLSSFRRGRWQPILKRIALSPGPWFAVRSPSRLQRTAQKDGEPPETASNHHRRAVNSQSATSSSICRIRKGNSSLPCQCLLALPGGG